MATVNQVFTRAPRRAAWAFLTLLFSLSLPSAARAAEIPKPAMIPAPQKAEWTGEGYALSQDTRIHADRAARDTAEYLAGKLRPSTGFALRVERSSKAEAPRGILLTTAGANTNLGPEGYQLEVSSQGVVLRAPAPMGLFYGVQTLLQLLPVGIFATNSVRDAAWTLPGIRIEDQPRFRWRGLMLDSSRHFFSPPEVKQVLDAMALLKLNTFHWHLVDDQGWRVAIRKYPQLTEIGAWRSGVGFGLDPKSTTAYGPDGRYGGFYTRADIRDVVAYARARHIEIVPEIEMPGHSSAALAAFPELSCAKAAFSPNASAGVHNGVYCAGKEETFEFLRNVLSEIMEMFPGRYIHVGGDEVPKDNWSQCARCRTRMQSEGLKDTRELQSYFVRRIEKFINSKGRTLVGWSEIREGGLAQKAVVMDWIGGGGEAAAAGHDVVMSPTSHCYFDYYQARDHSDEPRAIGGFIPLSEVYAFEPIPQELAPRFHPHILGAQGNLWTEYIPNLNQAEYMLFPRLSALAEVVWSPGTARDFEDFNRRLQAQNLRFDQLHIRYRRENWAVVGGWVPDQLSTAGGAVEWDVTRQMTAAGPRRVRFSHLEGADDIKVGWVALLEDGRELCRESRAGAAGPNSPSLGYTLDLPAPKPGARYTLRAHIAGTGGLDSRGEVSWSLNPAP